MMLEKDGIMGKVTWWWAYLWQLLPVGGAGVAMHFSFSLPSFVPHTRSAGHPPRPAVTGAFYVANEITVLAFHTAGTDYEWSDWHRGLTP